MFCIAETSEANMATVYVYCIPASAQLIAECMHYNLFSSVY